MDGFRIGHGGEALCRVELAADDPAARGLFDRAYAIVCRDAATPIGRIYILRGSQAAALTRIAATRAAPVSCTASANAPLADAGNVRRDTCVRGDGAGYAVISTAKGRDAYVVEGLGGYRSALELALRSLYADRIVDGPIEIATTEVGDPAAFARAQAGSIDRERALIEGYRRNNSGSFAEASEFFDTLFVQADTSQAGSRPGEYLVNQALQQSNLGDFERADALFAQALALPSTDPVELRLRRNFLAIHRLNQRQYAEALTELDRSVTPVLPPVEGAEIDAMTARALNDSVPLARQIGLSDAERLTPAERAAVLDAQAEALRGATLRRQGQAAAAAGPLARSLEMLAAVRMGRVASAAPIRAQVLTEQAALAEKAGDQARARSLLDQAVILLETQYPGSPAATVSRARLGAYLVRRGQTDEALTTYRAVIAALGTQGGATGVSVGALLEPYFSLLATRAASDQTAMADLFLASQTLVGAGVADTQAALSRELSAGDGEAARLFRQSVTLTREAQALRVEIARLASLARPAAQDIEGLQADRARLADAESAQVATQAKLADYPAYRVVGPAAMGIDELRAVLKVDEGYWKLAVVGRSVFGLFVTKRDAVAWKTPLTATELDRRVDDLRDTIAKTVDGQVTTYPFDVTAARALYLALAGPAAARIAATPHLVFEPDGAMQRLPAALLIADDAGLAAYRARIAKPEADPFDMTGVGWLGAKSALSTSVSARGFRDGRRAPASAGTKAYAGFGQNAPVSALQQLTGGTTRGGEAATGLPGAGPVDCRWPLTAWSRPIDPAELFTAKALVGGASDVETGAAFTDEAVMARRDLAQFRILHFATHGLVTGPLPQCPARPALLTSFGDAKSDGLLSFREIYDLRIDADLVILSACDTASGASVLASAEAGLNRGGSASLDGLVRAFVGAGGRSVLASHWPAPDDFDATKKLVTGLFAAPAGTGTADALKAAQVRLMNDPATSHPYYWAGFVLVGDGERPVRAR